MTHRPIREIASEIRRDWKTQGKGVNPAAKPYLEAMDCLNLVSDKYGLDSGEGILLRFLCNAGTWRGETAKRIKAELKAICGIK